MTEIKFSDIFKNKEAFGFKTYEDGLMKYVPSAEKYGIEKEEDLPPSIEVSVYIGGVYGIYISRVKFDKGTEMYNNLLTKSSDLPVFVDIQEDIPDNTYWATENGGTIGSTIFWYKDGKFFEFGIRACMIYEDGYVEMNDDIMVFKNLEQIATEYLTWGNNYRDRNEIKLIPIQIKANNKILKRRKEKCNLNIGEIYPIKNTDLVGAKYTGKIDSNYEFEIYLKNDDGKWVYQNMKTERSDPNSIIPNAVTYDGEVYDIDIEKTGAIIVDDQLIPISFIQGKIALYDFIKGSFREMTDDDFKALDDKEIFGIKIQRIE